jgi:hemerythrin
MQLLWSQQFETGNDTVDSQHKKLFEIVNNLAAAVEQNNLETQVTGTLKALEIYAVEHFVAEEELMERSFYPNRTRHHNEHGLFAAELKHLLNRHAQGSATLANAVSSFVGNWLAKHILTEDLEFIRWCQQKL